MTDYILSTPEPKDDHGRGPGYKIPEIWVYVAEDESGAEGVISVSLMIMGAVPSMVPLYASDVRRRDIMREQAVKAGRIGRKRVKLLKFGAREEVEVIYEPPAGEG